MSYDIFLACLRDAHSPRFKREVFEEIFLPHCAYLKSYRDDPGSMAAEPTFQFIIGATKKNRLGGERASRRKHLSCPNFRRVILRILNSLVLVTSVAMHFSGISTRLPTEPEQWFMPVGSLV